MEMLSLVSCDVPDGRFLVFCVKPGGGQLPCYKDARAVRKGAQREGAESPVLLPNAMSLNHVRNCFLLLVQWIIKRLDAYSVRNSSHSSVAQGIRRDDRATIKVSP